MWSNKVLDSVSTDSHVSQLSGGDGCQMGWIGWIAKEVRRNDEHTKQSQQASKQAKGRHLLKMEESAVCSGGEMKMVTKKKEKESRRERKERHSTSPGEERERERGERGRGEEANKSHSADQPANSNTKQAFLLVFSFLFCLFVDGCVDAGSIRCGRTCQ